MSRLWNYRHWVDIYITDKSVSLLSMQFLNTPMPSRPIPELPSLYITQCVSLYRHWVDIYITDASVSMLSIQLLEHTYAPGMEIPIPELPSLGRHIYHRCVSLYAEHTIIEKQLCPGMEIPIPKLPSLGRHIYITDASVSILSMQLLGHTYVPGMEIPIPELPSLGRHIYHICVSLHAEHTIIGPHL